MSAENFNTFLETDPGSVIARTSSRVTWTDMEARQDNSHVSLDKGVAFFDDSFVHTLTISLTASEKAVSKVFYWAMTNDLDDFQGLLDNSKDGLFLRCTHPNSPDVPVLRLIELDSGSVDSSGTEFNLTAGVIYYLTITRDETIGSFGDLICKIYSDAARTTLLDTLTANLNVKTDFRYVMVGQSEGAPSGGSTIKKQTGYSEDLDLEVSDGSSSGGATPLLLTQPPIDILATTATGGGYTTSLGLSAVTAHGVVWDTSPIDTSVVPGSQPNSTDEGAGSIGPFTSSITGLQAGAKHYYRAYATNSHGTTYGLGFSWFSGAPATVLSRGNIQVVGTHLHYAGTDGREYWVQGQPV